MNVGKIDIYQFGPFSLNINTRRLLRNGQPVKVTAKILDMLLFLVQNRGRLITKEELMKAIWPDRFVEDNNLTVSMSALRKILSEGQTTHDFIETVPTRGYRFTAQVTEVKDQNVELPPGRSDQSEKGGEIDRHDKDISSLAVLPFVNESEETTLEYVSDGITESIINALSHLSSLKIMARNTVFRYKGHDVDVIEVGKKLNVQAILVGRVIKFNDRLVIRAEMVNVSDGSQIWGAQYNRQISDIFDVQEEIAKEVSINLQLKLSGEDRRRLSKRYTENAEAYQLYLKGRYFWNKFNKEWVNKSLQFFHQAIEIDSTYALAYAGLADSYLRLAAMNLSPKDVLSKAKAAATKAVELDDSLAEAHVSFGLVKLWHDHDWIGAEYEYQRAIDLNPASSLAHQEYGSYFMFLGRFDEALAEQKVALELDPLSLQLYVDLGATLYMMKQYDQAIVQFQKTLDLVPQYYPARYALAWSYIQKGEFEGAFAELEQIWQLGEDSYLALGLKSYAHAVSGDLSRAEEVLEKLKETAKLKYISPYSMVLVYVGLNRKEEAFQWLERLYTDYSYWVVWLKILPELDGLRSDPRFRSLLQRVNFGERVYQEEKAVKSLAILPLTNISDDPSLDYFSDGITENIINRLSQLAPLKVMARSTVFRYKGRDVNPLKAGREIRVQVVLQGSMLKLEDNLIIKLELIDVADGSQIWGEQYSKKISDILIVQEEIAREISEKLRLKLTGKDKKILAKRYTEKIEAYHLYLKGRYSIQKFTEEASYKGIDYFTQAIEIDPNYALAYAGLADSYYSLAHFYLPTVEVIPKAKAALKKALKLDPTLAEAHTSLAVITAQVDWQWSNAEAGFKRAIELNPSYATAYHHYGLVLALMGRYDEAVAQLNMALELDPLSIHINACLAAPSYFSRQYKRAIAQLQKLLELEPKYWVAHLTLGEIYERSDHFTESLAELQKASQLADHALILACFGRVYAITGKREEAHKVIAQLIERSKQSYVSPYYIAIVYAYLDDKTRAFEWLEKAYEVRDEALVFLKVGPELDSLRSDPRFADLLQRVGFIF